MKIYRRIEITAFRQLVVQTLKDRSNGSTDNSMIETDNSAEDMNLSSDEEKAILTEVIQVLQSRLDDV